jgi:AcrR family transcriptional regulator
VPIATEERRPARAYRSPTRAERARRTRARILDAAQRRFVERGYPATTMRSIAESAGVAVPTVEVLFGTKAHLLTSVIDVAIAGDDEPVAVLDRDWTAHALRQSTAPAFLGITATVLRTAQERSAGVLLAAYEAAASDATVARLVDQQERRRAVTARWVVDGVVRLAALRPGLTSNDATDSVWLLMDPVVFVRLTRRRDWPPERYETWWAESVLRLLTDEEEP